MMKTLISKRRAIFKPHAYARLSTGQSELYDPNKEYPKTSLEKFYADVGKFELSDENALAYMKFAAKLSRINFASEEELLSFKTDFQSALAFIAKLDEVDA